LNARKFLNGPALVVSCLVAGAAFGASAPSQTAVDVAYQYVERNQQRLGLDRSDTAEMVVSSQVASEHNGVTHVYLQQRYRGIDVYNGILNVNVLYGKEVLSAGNRFVRGVQTAAGEQSARQTPLQAIRAAAAHLGLSAKQPFAVLDTLGGDSRQTTISDGGVAVRPIDAKLVWYPVAGGLRLAWSLEIEESARPHWWVAFVDATSGAVLGQEDLVVHDSALATASAIGRPASQAVASPLFPAADGASYNVFPLPLENPNDGGRQVVTNPADPAASPFGWHDTNGIDGPEFTVTRGNNVHAYTDIDANNIPDPGSDPDGGGTLTFDFPLDLSMNPPTYRPAAVTNLFYWNNIMHDVTYGYGFNEPGGNFQVNTYGHGGLGNDDVRAEAQDGSGTNNANFGTGVDGTRPRMQMFVWTNPLPNFVTVNSPAGIADDYPASGAVFGPTLGTTGPITGNVSLVNDGVGATSDACEPLVGFPAGDIALLDRGSCTFVIKVKNAQNAGASSVIIANNVAGNPITMGGTDATIVIPSVMVSLDNGNLFKANLPINATLSANPLTSVNRDSDLDAGVIAHEYGHGISNRLTGGPGTASCLGNVEQMGEGWSDWFALTLTADPSDTGPVGRGVGTYLIYQGPDGIGIRNRPYSTDMAVNESTYAWVADTVNVSQPHGIGFVWNTMLWEMYWNLIDRHGFNSDIYGGSATGGNNLAFQLVMDGLKLQPCQPGFVDGRNAILGADLALTGGTNQCEIWRGFAKRGLGFSADQGSSNSRLDGVEAFDLPAACTQAVFGGFKSPVSNPPAINNANAGSTIPVKFHLSGVEGLPPVDTQEVDCTTLQPTGEAPEAPATPGGTGMKRKGIEFQLNWQTDASWAGTCRKFTVRIPAPADGVAYFSFF
jgi:hypothetical protein